MSLCTILYMNTNLRRCLLCSNDSHPRWPSMSVTQLALWFNFVGQIAPPPLDPFHPIDIISCMYPRQARPVLKLGADHGVMQFLWFSWGPSINSSEWRPGFCWLYQLYLNMCVPIKGWGSCHTKIFRIVLRLEDNTVTSIVIDNGWPGSSEPNYFTVGRFRFMSQSLSHMDTLSKSVCRVCASCKFRKFAAQYAVICKKTHKGT